MNKKIAAFSEYLLQQGRLSTDEINTLACESRDNLSDLLYWADKIRKHYFGNTIRICSIVPGRLGGCSEDCKFCAQSSRYKTGYAHSQTLSDEEILEAANQAESAGLTRFGIVYSGRSVDDNELLRLRNIIKKIKEGIGLNVCGSFGTINYEQAARLVEAGLSIYNHNLETSQRNFANIVTTHRYADRVKTIKAAKEAGLDICAGGIFGIGESETDRIQMAVQLRELDVHTVPMNFLHPVKGTPLENQKSLEPLEILRIIALYRLILPDKTLKIAGGRVLNLRDLQSWMFYAGANAILSGNYLTTSGRAVKEDLQMLCDLGLQADTG